MIAATIINAGTLSGPGPSPGAPVAAFTVDNTEQFVGSPSQFTDLSTGAPTYWNWFINGVLFSSDQNPTYYWSYPGDYIITMTAFNAFGSNDASPLTVRVVPIR